MNVSVIIPVYDAADYVRQAVESALAQPETVEAILVEDGSPDNSLAVCRELAAEYQTVYLYQHSDGRNHGAGATRNLAILKSTCEYVAFLDADDFFLPGRFSTARELFETDPTVEGVYEAIGKHIESEAGARRWDQSGHIRGELHTMTERVQPEQLLAALVRGGMGDFSIDGLIVKHSVFAKSGLMDTNLRLHQDTAFLIKLAAVAKLVPGRLDEPVAMWRVHEHNRISAPRSPSKAYRDLLACWETLWHWGRSNLKEEQQRLLLEGLLRRAEGFPRFARTYPRWARPLMKRLQLGLLLAEIPALGKEMTYWRRFIPGAGFFKQRLQCL